MYENNMNFGQPQQAAPAQGSFPQQGVQPNIPPQGQSQNQNNLEKSKGIFRYTQWVRDTNTGKKQYKAKFSPLQSPDKEFSLTCFNTTKGFDVLQPGSVYTIGYVFDAPFTNKQGQVVSNSKTAMFFQEDSQAQTSQHQVQNTGTPNPTPYAQPTHNAQAVNSYGVPSGAVPQSAQQYDKNVQQKVQFIQNYKATVKQQGLQPNLEHAIGSYLIQYASDKIMVQNFKQLWNQY